MSLPSNVRHVAHYAGAALILNLNKEKQRKRKDKKMKTNDVWKMVIQLVLSVLSAVATTLGVTSCIGA